MSHRLVVSLLVLVAGCAQVPADQDVTPAPTPTLVEFTNTDGMIAECIALDGDTWDHFKAYLTSPNPHCQRFTGFQIDGMGVVSLTVRMVDGAVHTAELPVPPTIGWPTRTPTP